MLNKQTALTLIQDSLDSLYRSGTVRTEITVSEDTVLMGSDVADGLDSLGFVNFVMDVEDRLQKALDAYYSVVLTEIGGFDVNNPVLTASVLADHLVTLAEEG